MHLDRKNWIDQLAADKAAVEAAGVADGGGSKHGGGGGGGSGDGGSSDGASNPDPIFAPALPPVAATPQRAAAATPAAAANQKPERHQRAGVQSHAAEAVPPAPMTPVRQTTPPRAAAAAVSSAIMSAAAAVEPATAAARHRPTAGVPRGKIADGTGKIGGELPMHPVTQSPSKTVLLPSKTVLLNAMAARDETFVDAAAAKEVEAPEETEGDEKRGGAEEAAAKLKLKAARAAKDGDAKTTDAAMRPSSHTTSRATPAVGPSSSSRGATRQGGHTTGVKPQAPDSAPGPGSPAPAETPVSAAEDALAAAAGNNKASAAEAGPGRHISPRRRMPINSRIEVSKCG